MSISIFSVSCPISDRCFAPFTAFSGDTLTAFPSVTGLMPSSDPVPYPVAGRLYEATVKADALVGTVMPVAWDFNARAESGANYPALATVSSLSAAPIGQGGTTTGKVYFDIVGDVPNSVVFNNGFEDILGWIQRPGISPGGSPTGGGGASTDTSRRRWQCTTGTLCPRR